MLTGAAELTADEGDRSDGPSGVTACSSTVSTATFRRARARATSSSGTAMVTAGGEYVAMRSISRGSGSGTWSPATGWSGAQPRQPQPQARLT
jgi:hypothetical protein